MNIISLIKFITGHPLNQNNKFQAILRFVKWQVGTRLLPYPIIYPFTENSKLIIRRGMTGATGNLYCGLHEFNDMGFLIHLLRKQDFFIDVGANIGSYTVLASGHIGATTYSFEPVPSTFSSLIQNISINQIGQKVTAFNVAVGSQKGCINFTSSFDTLNHVASGEETDVIKVPVDTLDNILVDQRVPLVLKIDVEGFETEVLKGATHVLQEGGLKAIIIELNGSGARYGYDERSIHDQFLSLGFKPHQYDPKKRMLSIIETFGSHNTIYIRDLDYVQERVRTAPKIKILSSEV